MVYLLQEMSQNNGFGGIINLIFFIILLIIIYRVILKLNKKNPFTSIEDDSEIDDWKYWLKSERDILVDRLFYTRVVNIKE